MALRAKLSSEISRQKAATDFRLAFGFRRRFQRVGDTGRCSGHVRKEKIYRALLPGRQTPCDFALRATAARRGNGQDSIAPGTGEVGCSASSKRICSRER